MERFNVIRQSLLFLAASTWIFLLLALGSFHPTDWPSHQVYPYPPIQNLCGSAGSFVAYYMFLAIGQGVFPVLFFTGVCLALYLFNSRVSDIWLRVVGLLLLSTAFAATVHNFKPGSATSFPEGHGGIIGIGASAFLQQHFNTVGTRLILATGILIGLLLVADDLVLRTPGFLAQTATTVREKTPQINWNFIPVPKLPSLPTFVTRDAAVARPGKGRDRDGGIPLKASDSKAEKTIKASSHVSDAAVVQVAGRLDDDDEDIDSRDERIELTYENDDPTPVAVDAAFIDASDPGPAEAATIPPPDIQAPAVAREAGGDGDDTASTVGAAPAAEAAEAPPAPKAEIIVKLASINKPRPSPPPPPPPPRELGEYHMPTWENLEEAEHGYAEAQEKFVREKAAVLEKALQEFNIDAHVVEIDTGPVITMYELSLAPGIKVASITQLTNDIARALAATSVRIVAPVPGKSTVGIEVPNAQKEKVRLKELMQLAPEKAHKMQIPLYLGKDASGEPLVTDLAAMPHCLIAGTTGSGKSVCINTIIMSIMYMQRPDMVKLILIDPKVVEMAPFKDVPHLMCPVINDCSRATAVLEWACNKMDERYELLAEAGVRHIKDYNKLTREELVEKFQPATEEEEAKIPKFLPYVVIIVDELADLMMTSGKEVESFIVRIAQKARAVGIHLILATQRPSANVVTGLIKSNMPSRIAFRVQSRMDSRIVLDQNGADLLLGQGDMLFLPNGANKPIRSQGTYIDDKEIHRSVKLVKTLAEAQYEPELVQIKGTVGDTSELEKDELFDDAVRVVLETKRGSVSLLQRRLNIGYGRAARLIELMAACGILGDYKGTQARECTLSLEEWEQMQANKHADAESGMTV